MQKVIAIQIPFCPNAQTAVSGDGKSGRNAHRCRRLFARLRFEPTHAAIALTEIRSRRFRPSCKGKYNSVTFTGTKKV
jgi:hypothetical protein